MQKLLDGSNITLGTCYYPEHWGREMWAEDLNRMREAGIKCDGICLEQDRAARGGIYL